MVADLHVHTNFSDGTHSPEEVVEQAKKVGLKTIAITDHDVIDGVGGAVAVGGKLGVEVIAGIEFTTEIPKTEIHILGYFIDLKNVILLETLEKIQEGRRKRIYKMVDKLKGLKVEIPEEKISEIVKLKSPGRPHLARVLLEEGLVMTFKEAFDRYLDFHAPAYVGHYKLSPWQAIGLIRKADGIAVYAHPGTSNCDLMIPQLMAGGLAGIEVYYTGHSQSQTNHYLHLARKYGLLVTGGSDYHGFRSGREVELGRLTIPDELVEKLRARR